MVQKILIFNLTLVIFLSLFFNNIAKGEELIEGIGKVIDGDTVHIGSFKIRLHGIDAPELNQKCKTNKIEWYCGIESSKFLKNMINQKNIYCKTKGKDKYRRYIGVCYILKKNINKTIVREGWAIAYKFYSRDYENDENFAKKNKKGIWNSVFIEPYLFRKKNN